MPEGLYPNERKSRLLCYHVENRLLRVVKATKYNGNHYHAPFEVLVLAPFHLLTPGPSHPCPLPSLPPINLPMSEFPAKCLRVPLLFVTLQPTHLKSQAYNSLVCEGLGN